MIGDNHIAIALVNLPSQSRLDLSQLFPFELDDFQYEAINALDADKSVVVCAPTGSGKTLIGEYAIHRALAHGKRVFYTTPLKALSNQKLRDFRNEFGADRVGLLTGDLSLQREAPILVMTTEIFRNMLYGTPIGQVGTSLVDVEAVVLDECHYMNDRQRGTVWEESIIYCPPGVQLVALSATIANSDQLTDWIGEVHGPTELIYSDFRPVPLDFHFCNPKGLFPLLNDSGKGVNPRLKPKGGKQRGRQEAPSIAFVASQLQQRDMLPAIYFIFSRRGCDKAVSDMANASLVTPEEAATLRAQIDDFLERNPEAGRSGYVESLYRGIASHHAGVLPAWKGLIEELFQQGLIKIVFATETLAAGINMPARTTVISSLSKRTDRGHRLLNASEFLQMAGRAGRRGMDERGHVVTVQTPFEGVSEAVYLATSKADPLVSQFSPSYGMVLNLLQTHNIEEAQNLIERSFGNYLSTLYLRPQQQAINDLTAAIAHQQQQVGIDPELVAGYEKLNERLKEERRLLKTLHQQAYELESQHLATALSFAVAGTILSLKGKHVPVAEPLGATLVLKIPGSGRFPFLVCLGKDNRWYVVTVSDVAGLHAEFPRLAQADQLTPPAELAPKPGSVRKGDQLSEAVAHLIPMITPELSAPEVRDQQGRVAAVEAQLQAHPLHQLGDPAQLLKRRRRIERMQEELASRQQKLEQHTKRYWQEFLDLMAILQAFDCLEDAKPKPLGQVAAAIRGDNELWLGLALASGELDALDPHYLAAACASLVTEVSRPDIWTRYEPSREIEEALGGLRGLRRELFKLQRRYNIAMPVWLETEWIGLVEQWALGVDWPELCENTSLDEGDVVRILRRTVDFLSQVPHVPYISGALKDNANRAIQLIDRFPVNEGID
ncbi:MAG: DEAD/DEAH box helicase [Pegethrix bostrychoides GSE-TBD4-15B]|jgi:superfamily II RNA helicase|uniref:DEAD/DEAH box helicase n=1 Tax=Pegethrix bostrychoides GSE-TBD4-15B TaxID=2839662 RepID=A0A951U6E0_9CYAN|nr:DEAD/DEAH box helicase [Pegethrix bostrychoides GSE-TBD4-15B]